MTITNSLATAYSGQKKAKTLASGDTIFVVQETTTQAIIKKRTSAGVTSTLTNGTVLGWTNGSMDIYQDAGGTWRIAICWKQSGTGGSRTSGQLYVMVGSFDAGFTTITWGSAVDWPVTSTADDYPDLVAIAHGVGTGGAIAMVSSSLYGGAQQVRCYFFGVSANTPTYNTVTGSTGGTNYGSASDHFYPSICVDTSNRLHLAFSLGASTGGDIVYRHWTYGASGWSGGADVTVSSSVYAEAAYNGPICQWDATGSRAVIGIFSGVAAPRTLNIWDSTSFTSFTNRVSQTFANDVSFYGFGMAIDTAGHVYCHGSAYTSAYTEVAYIKATRSGSSLSLGSRTVLDSFLAETGNPPYVFAWYADGQLRWLYTHGNNSPYSVKYDQLLLATNATVTPSTVTATATVYTPALQAQAKPGTVAASATIYTPSLAASAVTAPSTVTATVTFPAPTLVEIAKPGAVAATATVYTPAITASATVTPGTVTCQAGFPQAVGAEITYPQAVAATASYPSVAVTTTAVVAPAVVSRSASYGAPALSASANVAVTTVGATASYPAVSISASAAVPGAVVTATASFPSPSYDVKVFPATVTPAASFGAPGIQATAVISPSVVAATASYPTVVPEARAVVGTVAASATYPAPVLDVKVSPATVLATASFPAPHTFETPEIQTVQVPVTIGAPSITATALVPPVPVVTATATYPAPVATPTATPATVAAQATVYTPAVQADVSLVPATILVPAEFRAPSIAASGSVNPGTVGASATIYTPTVTAGAAPTIGTVGATAFFPQVLIQATATVPVPATVTASVTIYSPKLGPTVQVVLAAASFGMPRVLIVQPHRRRSMPAVSPATMLNVTGRSAAMTSGRTGVAH